MFQEFVVGVQFHERGETYAARGLLAVDFDSSVLEDQRLMDIT